MVKVFFIMFKHNIHLDQTVHIDLTLIRKWNFNVCDKPDSNFNTLFANNLVFLLVLLDIAGSISPLDLLLYYLIFKLCIANKFTNNFPI